MLEKILSCALAIFLAAGSAEAAAPKSATPPAVVVEAARVQSGPVERTIEAVGNLISNESVVLSPEISGRVAEIFFDEGAAVTAGMPLIRLDDSIYKAQLAQANASLILSEANHKRAEELYKQQSGTGRARCSSRHKVQGRRCGPGLRARCRRKARWRCRPRRSAAGSNHRRPGTDALRSGPGRARPPPPRPRRQCPAG